MNNKELIAKIDEWQSKQDYYHAEPWDLLCYSRDALDAAEQKIVKLERDLAKLVAAVLAMKEGEQ